MKEVGGSHAHVVECHSPVPEEILALVTDDHHHVGPVRAGRVARAEHQREEVQPRQRHLVLIMEMVTRSALKYSERFKLKCRHGRKHLLMN